MDCEAALEQRSRCNGWEFVVSDYPMVSHKIPAKRLTLTYTRFIAAEKPPHLKAIAPWEGISDFYRESICRGGIPNPAFWDILCKDINGLRLREDVCSMVEKYPLWNAYWDDKKAQLANIDIPMYVLASYSTQLHTEGSIRGWKYASSKQKW